MMSNTGPSSAPLDQPFWDGLADGRLMIPACNACAHWIWPPQWRCGECGSWDMAWREVEQRAVVHSLTNTHHPFTPEMVGRTPFATLLVELPQAGGVRLLGQVADGGEAPSIGACVVAEMSRVPPVLRWRVIQGEAA